MFEENVHNINKLGHNWKTLPATWQPIDDGLKTFFLVSVIIDDILLPPIYKIKPKET